MLLGTANLLTATGPVQVNRLQGGEKIVFWTSPGKLSTGTLSEFRIRKARSPLMTITANGRRLSLPASHPVLTASSARVRSYDLVLVERLNTGAALGIVQGLPEGFHGGGTAYRIDKEAGPGRERSWIIERISDKREARYRLHFFACRFGLPVVELSHGWGGIDRRDLNRLFNEKETLKNAEELKKTCCMDDGQSHFDVHLLDEVTRSRRILADLLIFGSPTGHLLTVYSLAESAVTERGFCIPTAGRVFTFTDIESAAAYIKANLAGDFVDYQVRALVAGTVYRLQPSAYLRTGMRLPSIQHGKISATVVSSVERNASKALLHSFSIGNAVTVAVENLIIGLPVPLGKLTI